MNVKINVGYHKGRNGIAKRDDEHPEECMVDILNPDGSVHDYSVWYGEDELIFPEL